MTSGDTIDLTNTNDAVTGQPCNEIQLESELFITQNDLTIIGRTHHAAGASSPDTSIRGNSASRLIAHLGNGTLQLENLILSDGGVSQNAAGGCVITFGSLELNRTWVRECTVTNPANSWSLAMGGAIHAQGAV